jgi:branched-chain amino acid transport system permease protein
MLLLMNDIVTKLTSHYGIVLGGVILLFALGLRKGVLDFVADMWRDRRQAVLSAESRAEPASTAKAVAAGE